MTSIEWLEQIAKSMVINGGDLGEDYPALKKHIQKAKEMHKAEQETLYTEEQVRKIIRKSQIRDEFGIFVYPNEDELLNLKLK